MSNDFQIDLYPIRCSCGNSYFFIDAENMELICSKCNKRIQIDKLNIENEFIEICVKDTCVTLTPYNSKISMIMNELAYYSSNSNSTSTNIIENKNVVRIPLASLIIISLYLFFFILVFLNIVLNVFPFSLISIVFMIVVVVSFFLSLFL